MCGKICPLTVARRLPNLLQRTSGYDVCSSTFFFHSKHILRQSRASCEAVELATLSPQLPCMMWGMMGLVTHGRMGLPITPPIRLHQDFATELCLRVSSIGTHPLKSSPRDASFDSVSMVRERRKWTNAEDSLLREAVSKGESCFQGHVLRNNRSDQDRGEPNTNSGSWQLYKNHGLSCGVSWLRAYQAGRTRTAVDAGAIPSPKAWQRALGLSLKMKGYLAPYRDMVLNGLT